MMSLVSLALFVHRHNLLIVIVVQRRSTASGNLSKFDIYSWPCRRGKSNLIEENRFIVWCFLGVCFFALICHNSPFPIRLYNESLQCREVHLPRTLFLSPLRGSMGHKWAVCFNFLTLPVVSAHVVWILQWRQSRGLQGIVNISSRKPKAALFHAVNQFLRIILAKGRITGY